ncbi:MAG: hypothetical protein K0R29_773 [Pseudobdellovibrio sp.]|nr:hypothetical protein [Pseudobdellovibrio sp.]
MKPHLRNLILAATAILALATAAKAATLNDNLLNPGLPKAPTVLNSGTTPLKKNPFTVDGRTYLLPDYLKIIKSEDGKFSIDKKIDHKVGNGGDYLRGQFIALGQQIILFLEETEDGQNLVSSRQLNVEALKSTLDINKLTVVQDLLIDNSGSVVDAIGVPDLIIINADSWMDHFERERNIYYLVFHEMLRSAAINDDNYVVSQPLMNFPAALKVRTQLVPTLPLLDEDNLSNIIARGSLQTGGTGCTNNGSRLFTDMNLSQNTLDLTFYDYVTKLNSTAAIDRKACSLTLPITLPKNKKLVVSLIDVQGQIDSSVAGSKSLGRVTFEAFLAGTNQPSQVKQIAMAQGKKSFLMRKTNLLSSACGGQSLLRLNSNIILQKGAGQVSQLANPEVLQIKKIRVFLSVEDCTQQ